MTMEDPVKGVDDFLRSTRLSSTANKCKTCTSPRVDEVNAAIRRFMELRAVRQTSMSMEQFRRDYLEKRLGYEVKRIAFVRHVRECLGIKEA